MKLKIMFFVFLTFSFSLLAANYYVSANTGKGKDASIENPAKDLGNIIEKLAPGDTIHIAGGTYIGKAGNGSDVITVPISIIGGYDDSFKTRDPWGKSKTILSGDNMSKNFLATPRVHIDLSKYRGKEMPKIVVDGIIIDHAERNRYKTDEQLEIVRKADPKTGKNATPDMGGLVISTSKTSNFQDFWDVTVQNCIVMNTAPTQGAMSVSGYEKSKITIKNNLIVNNTGIGLSIGSNFHPKDGKSIPDFTVENNTILFTWKYDSYVQSFSGTAIKVDADASCNLQNNIFAFSDIYGVDNSSNTNILLKNNLIFGNIVSDYLEFNTKIDLENIEDESSRLLTGSTGNVADKITIPVSSAWSKLYGARTLIDRNAVEADIKVQNTRINELRSVLGLPLQAGNVNTPSSPVWLNRISIDDVVNIGKEKYLGKYGCNIMN